MKILIFLLFLQTLPLITSTIKNISFNLSNHLFLNPDSEINNHHHESHHQHFPHFLKDVLNKIADKQKWRLKDVLVSKFDLGSARIGRSMQYDVRLRIGSSDLYFGVTDDVVSWKKLKNVRGGDGFESLKDEVGSFSLIDSLKLEGPFELHGNDTLSLLLPMNRTLTGLKRVVVGEGITVEVKGAREVSIFCSSDLDLPVNRSSVLTKTKTEVWPLGHASCASLLPIHILGSSSLVAYKTQNPDAYIETSFLTNDIIELLPEKCYNRHVNRKRVCPISRLRLRIASMEKLLRTILGGRYSQNGLLGSVKVKVKASAVVRFRLELERRIERRQRLQGVWEEWRTWPTVERNSFEILARVEEETLKPLSVKKTIPFDVEDSIALSSLMSNISFTKFPSLLVHPEALTLDVKW